METQSLDSGWLSPLRIRRAIRALAVLPPDPDAWGYIEAQRLVWTRIGGPYPDVARLLDLLVDAALVRRVDDSISRMKASASLVSASEDESIRRLGDLLIRRGYFVDQARMLWENGRLGTNGELLCAPGVARRGAPQLLGLLSYWDGVEVMPEVKIPPVLLETLGLGAEVPPVEDLQPAWVREQKAVGNRAESYSVRWLRSSTRDPTQIAWVARDTDSLGYDVEDRRLTPPTGIEVKGSRSKEVAFVLSAHELERANELDSRYSLHFWGEIDLTRSVEREYLALLSAGYPIVLPNLTAELASGTWVVAPESWRVTRKLE